jgi:hypothetical protein
MMAGGYRGCFSLSALPKHGYSAATERSVHPVSPGVLAGSDFLSEAEGVRFLLL